MPKKKKLEDVFGGLVGGVVKAKKSRKKQLDAAHEASPLVDTGGKRTARTVVKKKSKTKAQKEKEALREKIRRRVEAEKKRQARKY